MFYTFIIIPFVASEECFKALFVRLQRKKLALAGVTEVRLTPFLAAAPASAPAPAPAETASAHQGLFCACRTSPGTPSHSALTILFFSFFLSFPLSISRCGIAGTPPLGGEQVTRAHLIHSTATSAGYALSQAMGWLTLAHMSFLSNWPGYKDNVWEQVGWMLLLGVLVTAFGTPLQLLSGYLVGLEVTRDNWQWWNLSLAAPTAIRSLYYITAVGFLIALDEVRRRAAPQAPLRIVVHDWSWGLSVSAPAGCSRGPGAGPGLSRHASFLPSPRAP